nr:hypothetical protein BaRGS_002095 [Batillaria attramentaria]
MKIPPRRPASHCLSARTAAVAALLLSILCLFLVAGCAVFFFIHHDQLLNNHPQTDANEQVCLPCIQVNPDPLHGGAPSGLLDKLERKYVKENDTELCCARTPAQYATLFKLILKRQEGVKKLADILGSNSNGNDNNNQHEALPSNAVSAHLLIKPIPLEQKDSSPEPLVQHWKSPQESPISHVRTGLKLHDNRIYVQDSGLYFVYCQILYNRADVQRPNDPEVASNYVKRSSVVYPATSGILLKARHTRYNQDRDRHSSYVGGLFFLHEGDELFVQVSYPELVSHDDTASFFGLFKVGE